jgi:hypothetical protein
VAGSSNPIQPAISLVETEENKMFATNDVKQTQVTSRINKVYGRVQKLSNLYSALLKESPALKDEFDAVQALENTAGDIFVSLVEATARMRQLESDASGVGNKMSLLNDASAQMAVALGLRKGDEIARFDGRDALSMAQNFEALFEKAKHRSLAVELKTARKTAANTNEKLKSTAAAVRQLENEVFSKVYELESALIDAKRKMVFLGMAVPKGKTASRVGKKKVAAAVVKVDEKVQ